MRWTAGVVRMDHIRSDAIRKKFGVAPIANKMLQALPVMVPQRSAKEVGQRPWDKP